MALFRNRFIDLFIMFVLLLSLLSLPSACSGIVQGAPDSLAILDTLATRDPATVDNSQLPITPVDKLHLTGSPQKVDIAEYNLAITGLVNNQLSLNYTELLAASSVTRTVLLICPGTFVDNAEWTGAPVSEILTEAGLKEGATTAVFTSTDGFKQEIPLNVLLQSGAFLSYLVNGETLPEEQGYPVRLVVPGNYGKFWVKWINSIEIK